MLKEVVPSVNSGMVRGGAMLDRPMVLVLGLVELLKAWLGLTLLRAPLKRYKVMKSEIAPCVFENIKASYSILAY